MAKMVRNMFGTVPDNLEDFAYASQACQAEGMKRFIEFFRSEKWRRTGVIWWNLIDGWPQFSDAVVDYYFEKKLAYDYIKRAQQPLTLIAREADGALALFASNDLRRDEQVDYWVKEMDTDNIIEQGGFLARGDSAALITTIEYQTAGPSLLMIGWRSASSHGVNHLLCGDAPYHLETYRRWIGQVYG